MCFADHISSPEHQVFVAVEAGEGGGFPFRIFGVQSNPSMGNRFLLSFSSTIQGRGIGTSLIEEALTYGSNLGVHWAKASIRVDNYASQRAFFKAGFTMDAQVRSLFIWDPLALQVHPRMCPRLFHLIPVDTLMYRGLWIEGFVESQLPRKEQHNVIRAARNSIFHEDRLNTGIFMPDSFKTHACSRLIDLCH